MKACKAICRPCDRIRLSGSCTVLDKVVFAGTMLPDVLYKFSYHIHLMISREYQGFLRHFLISAILKDCLFLLYLKIDKLLQDIKEAVLLQHVFPKVRGHIIAVPGLRISGSAVVSGAV